MKKLSSLRTMNVLTRFHHLNRVLLSENIKKIDSSLSNPQAIIILHISPDKAYSVGELAEVLDVTPSAITHASRILIKKGYLLRDSGQDLRKVYLKLTDKGHTLRNQIIEQLTKTNNTILNMLDETERKLFLKLVEKITKNISKVLEEEYDKKS